MTNAILYIVATPIGTLDDLSVRARNILTEVDFIACEDTRHTQKLLSHFGIRAKLESLHNYNEKAKAERLLHKLLESENKTAAIVSDAGTPCISDPGSILIACAHSLNIQVLSVPGPSSLTSALAACGFIQPRTLFSGFLERTKKDQQSEFSRWKVVAPCIAVFFESPKRILFTLKNMNEYFADESIKVSVSREISKKFEEHKIDSIENLITFFEARTEIKGEFVVCVNLNEIKTFNEANAFEFALKEVLSDENKNSPLKAICKEVAQKYNLNPKDLYNRVVKLI